MPDESVAVSLELVVRGIFDVSVGLVKGELATGRLGGLPLLGVLGCDRVEVVLVAVDGGLLRVCWVSESQSCSQEASATVLDGFIKAIVSVPPASLLDTDGGCGIQWSYSS